MVNTFLVYSDFKKSAECLDPKRLGKQRAEALMIITILENIELLSKIFKLPKPDNPYEYHRWIRELGTRYKQSGWFLFWQDNKLSKVARDDCPKETRYAMTKAGVRFIRAAGWFYHPAVLMWIGYDDALKEYLNVHIDRWVELGYNNNMKKYQLPENIKYPPWSRDHQFLESHRSNLIRKDYDFYTPLFPDTEPDLEYIWPYNDTDTEYRYHTGVRFVIL